MTDNVKNKMAGTGGQSHRRLWEFVFVAVLVLYPLRHIAWGLDLWDTGYGYANLNIWEPGIWIPCGCFPLI